MPPKPIDFSRFIANEAQPKSRPAPLAIEDGIPAPERGRARGPIVETMLGLQPGQSFLIPCEAGERKTVAARIASKKTKIERRRPELQFTTRQEPGGVRVWRTK